MKRRKALSLTQEDLARAIGVSTRTVQRWELGENLPEITVLQTWKLCRALKCTIDELAQDFYPDEFSTNGKGTA